MPRYAFCVPDVPRLSRCLVSRADGVVANGQTHAVAGGEMKRVLYLLVFAAVLVGGVTFSLNNSEVVTVKYYFDLQWAYPLSVFLLIALALGALLGFLASLGVAIRLRSRLSRTEKTVRKMEQEIKNLRALPIKDAL
jgi:putative membrane protein